MDGARQMEACSFYDTPRHGMKHEVYMALWNAGLKILYGLDVDIKYKRLTIEKVD
jgi:hypothetical protein